MKQTSVTAKWVGPELQYEGTDAKGNTVKLGGADIAPAQMVLLGLAGCMGMDTVHVLKRKRVDFDSIDVVVTGEQPDDYPKPFTKVEIKFTVTGRDVSPQAVERAIGLSRDKYCVVGQTLQNPVELVTAFEVISPSDD